MNLETNLFMVGVCFKKANTLLRGQFSLAPEQIESFVSAAHRRGVYYFFALSTCNRTEIYATTEHLDALIDVYCDFTNQKRSVFNEIGTVLKGNDVIMHFLKVSCGIESQILGDFEIVSQVKKWFQSFKSIGVTNTFLEKLYTTAIQTSKLIKNQTHISSGAASVSFAAVQAIINNRPNAKKIILLGAGKIGRNTCDSLLKHLPKVEIHWVNRSTVNHNVKGKIKTQMSRHKLEALPSLIKETDVLIVATSSRAPLVYASLFDEKAKTLVLDLSVPRNVAEDVEKRPHLSLMDVDALSKQIAQTQSSRNASLPKALLLVEQAQSDFYQWMQERRHAPILQSFKSMLEDYQKSEHTWLQKQNIGEKTSDIALVLSEKIIQKVTGQLAAYFKKNPLTADKDANLIKEIFNL